MCFSSPSTHFHVRTAEDSVSPIYVFRWTLSISAQVFSDAPNPRCSGKNAGLGARRSSCFLGVNPPPVMKCDLIPLPPRASPRYSGRAGDLAGLCWLQNHMSLWLLGPRPWGPFGNCFCPLRCVLLNFLSDCPPTFFPIDRKFDLEELNIIRT